MPDQAWVLIFLFVILPIGIANLVLWFKIWFMTNNVKKITNMMEDHLNPPKVVQKEVKKEVDNWRRDNKESGQWSTD